MLAYLSRQRSIDSLASTSPGLVRSSVHRIAAGPSGTSAKRLRHVSTGEGPPSPTDLRGVARAQRPRTMRTIGPPCPLMPSCRFDITTVKVA